MAGLSGQPSYHKPVFWGLDKWSATVCIIPYVYWSYFSVTKEFWSHIFKVLLKSYSFHLLAETHHRTLQVKCCNQYKPKPQLLGGPSRFRNIRCFSIQEKSLVLAVQSKFHRGVSTSGSGIRVMENNDCFWVGTLVLPVFILRGGVWYDVIFCYEQVDTEVLL